MFRCSILALQAEYSASLVIWYGTFRLELAILDSIVSSLDWSDKEYCPHIYFTGGYNEWLLVIVEKQFPKWVILVIWYGTLMLEYLLVE